MNLFETLSKYGRQQEENYFTTAFVYLLEQFREKDPPIFRDLLSKLSGLDFSGDQDITIEIEKPGENGRPDVKIQAFDKIVYCEHKVRSRLGDSQLERYEVDLKKQKGRHKKLVFISKYKEDTPELKGIVKHRWYDIYNWLEKITCLDPENQYLKKEFLRFMEGKQMAIKKIDGFSYQEFSQGWGHLQAFWLLLEHVLGKEGFRTKDKKDAFGLSAGGYYFNKGQSSDYWVGVWYNPLQFGFSSENMPNESIRYLEGIYGEGLATEETETNFSIPIEKIGLENMNKEEQIEYLSDFVKTCFENFERARKSRRSKVSH